MRNLWIGSTTNSSNPTFAHFPELYSLPHHMAAWVFIATLTSFGCQPMAPLPSGKATKGDATTTADAVSTATASSPSSTAPDVGLTDQSAPASEMKPAPTTPANDQSPSLGASATSPAPAASSTTPAEPTTPPAVPDLVGDDATSKPEPAPKEALLNETSCEEKPAPPANAKAPQLIALFDGKTLKNWKSTEFGGEGEVSVADGKLMLGVGSPLTGVTWHGPKLPTSNYEIQIEAMRVDGSDFFCGLTFPVKDDPCSLIIGGWGGGLVGLSSIDGMDASENQTGTHRSFENNKWYAIKLRVTDDNIVVWIDGEQVIEQPLKDVKLSIRIEVAPSKPLGICSFTSTAAIRKLELKELEKPKPATAP
ncbi:3-keto-disaccharide hydrolase [Planctopirus hydrillae]|uniref:3-keto-disaccharide hydrolase n=1 Tax=Planctopirus hydrillae TaxID=1841610 RepID=UPI000A4A43F8|nr:DUF1080 domain-containing protein [Planctopirus hydrillae]